MRHHVLLIGATGVFGRRLARHLARFDDIRLTLTSRTRAKADALAAELRVHPSTRAECTAIALDTGRDLNRFLIDLAPWLVIDASGPFQGSDTRVATAALDGGAHFIDLADARDYLSGYAAALGTLASGKGLVALAGVSSTPALSSAVVAHLTAGWSAVEAIEIAITPGGRSEVGEAVVAAILSYVGRPVPVFRDGRIATEPAWMSSTVKSMPGVGRRRVAVVETADAEGLSSRHGVRSLVIFRAGLESWLEQQGLTLLARARLLGVVGDAAWMVPALLWCRRLTRLPTGDRGGMLVEASGLDETGLAISAQWSLLATHNDGPCVPILAGAAAVRALLSQAARPASEWTLAPGAAPCFGLLPLAAIEAEARGYHITTSTSVTRAAHARNPGPD